MSDILFLSALFSLLTGFFPLHRHISTYLPFAVDSMNEQIYTTYLDTTGRPSIVLEKSHCSEKHSQLVYVSASDAIHAQNAL